MEQIAAAEGVDENEDRKIKSFSKDLVERFKTDLEKGFNNQ